MNKYLVSKITQEGEVVRFAGKPPQVVPASIRIDLFDPENSRVTGSGMALADAELKIGDEVAIGWGGYYWKVGSGHTPLKIG